MMEWEGYHYNLYNGLFQVATGGLLRVLEEIWATC